MIRSFPSAETRKGALVLLAGWTLFVVGWDLWAVTCDQRPSGSDTFTPFAIQLFSALGGDAATSRGISLLDPKGPLAGTLGAVLVLLVGKVPLATRLLSVLCHGVLLLQCYDLGHRLARFRRAGLWAALICGAHPMIFGWCRLDFHEPLLAALVIAALQLMLRSESGRITTDLLLGLVLGLGLLTKPSFAAYIMAPGLWLLIRRCLGGRRAMLRLLVVPAVMAALAGPWVIARGATLPVYFRMATQSGTSFTDKTLHYLGLPGSFALLAVAAVAAVLLWRQRAVDRWPLSLSVSQVAVTFLLLVTVFDPWSRYLVPALPGAAVLVAVGVDRLLRRAPPRWAEPFAWGLAAALIGLVPGLSLAARQETGRREEGAGMMAPDPRPFVAFARTAAALRPHGRHLLVVHDSPQALTATEGQELLWRFRGLHAEIVALDWAVNEIGHGRPVSVILVRRFPRRQLAARESGLWPDEPTRGLLYGREAEKPSWLAGQARRRRLLVAVDPDGIEYTAYRVGGPSESRPSADGRQQAPP